MRKKLKWIVLVLLLVVFFGAGGTIVTTQLRYGKSREIYHQAAESYTAKKESQAPASSAQSEKQGDAVPSQEEAAAPISVDFTALQKVNPEVVGWLYCEGTNLNYPVMHGEDNLYYLSHSYDRQEIRSGAVFMDAQSAEIFRDSNTVIYGHSMSDGSMFSRLEDWEDQAYFEKHSVMWLLTPDADYKIALYSGYTTSAYSDTYTIFRNPCDQLEDYLAKAKAQSDFTAQVPLERDGRYVVLSTCAYEFDDARYVLHGKLSKVEK